MSDHSPDDLKALLRGIQMIEANLENWRYVETNAEYMPNKQVADALGQILGLTTTMIESARGAIEIEALTTFDPIDLID
jgi:hypothetical protein